MLVVGCPTTHDVDEFVTREHRPKLLAELNETTSRVWRAEWGWVEVETRICHQCRGERFWASLHYVRHTVDVGE